MTKETKERIQYLLAQLVEGKASRREKQKLFEMIDESGETEEMQSIVEELITAEPEWIEYHPADWQPVIQSILEKKEPAGGVVRSIRKWNWIAAAAILILVAIGGYYFIMDSKEKPLASQPIDLDNDIAPGSDRAVLTLASGQQILLDSSTGTIATEAGITVINLSGVLSYDEQVGREEEVLYHTISTPRGGQYQLVLADGSKVWLNAASSLRFPTAFPGKERVVELKGEGYFEIAPSYVKTSAGLANRKSFMVIVNGMQVEVLGTHFNINSYADEGAIKTTLIEGSVRVREDINRESVKLTPGQQAILRQAQDDNSSSRLSVISGVDTDQVLAWKNGYFSFNNADLRSILRQASRWYDVDVSFEAGVPPVQFSGKIGRSLSLKEFLSILDDTRIRYRIEGKRLVITR